MLGVCDFWGSAGVEATARGAWDTPDGTIGGTDMGDCGKSAAGGDCSLGSVVGGSGSDLAVFLLARQVSSGMYIKI